MTPTPQGAAPPARPKRPPPPRSIRWLTRPLPGDTFGTVRISVGKEQSDYFARLLPSDFGQVFELTKLIADPKAERVEYHVLLDHEGGRHSCECLGFLRWSRCKHVVGLLALLERSPLPPAEDVRPPAQQPA